MPLIAALPAQHISNFITTPAELQCLISTFAESLDLLRVCILCIDNVPAFSSSVRLLEPVLQGGTATNGHSKLTSTTASELLQSCKSERRQLLSLQTATHDRAQIVHSSVNVI